MPDTIDDDTLASLDREAYVALLERLPEQADELRARRQKIHHRRWQERNKAKKAAWDLAYYKASLDGDPEERRAHWRKLAARRRARAKRGELEEKVVALRAEMKGTRGKPRTLLKARESELLAKIERLNARLEDG